ncbi:Fucose 4-O-acetylase [Butyrivibrio sp. ob235]|uniref:acyltransferase family protein n=1 Tax=Butyrivibrio sp. ob235 TaxID=1761780 RepID=UPI0008C52A41|nr:acyltransferase [Butyrivibrio sp. ob235]SEL73838.1 Fucose 4-O-acetylase [Butyrivibrio sp. ob235]
MKNQKYISKNTLGMFDLLKGIIMIIVMVGHTYGLLEISGENTFSEELLQQVNIFVLFLLLILKIFAETAMPAFFILSGYGFRKAPFIKSIRKQFHTLLIPYFISMFLATVIHFFSYLFLYSGIKASLKQTIMVFLGGLFGFPKDVYINDFRFICCGPLWFLLALAIAIIVFNLLANYFEDNRLLLVSFLVAFIGWLLSLAGTMPWSLSQGLISVFFLGIGYYAKKRKLFISSISKNYYTVLVGIAIVLYVMIIGTSSFFDMANDKYPLGPVSIIVYGILGIIVIKIFLQLNRFEGFLSSFIRKIGRLSLYILCIHSIEMVAIGGYLQYMFVNDWWKGSLALRNTIIIGIRIPFVLTVTFLFIYIKNAFSKSKK